MYKIKLGGIYIIEAGDYYYIGKSVDMFSRWQNHYTTLKQNKHSSPKLQQVFNQLGVAGLTFRVLEYVSITEFKKTHQIKGKELNKKYSSYLLRLEKEWMKKYSINYSLNNDNKSFS